jgi:hypothetical protein
MIKSILKSLQISILSAALLNFHSVILAAETTSMYGGEITKGIRGENTPQIYKETIDHLNKKLVAQGKPSITNGVDAYVANLSAKDKHSFYADLDKSNFEVRKSHGLASATIPRSPGVDYADQSEVHEKYVDDLTREKVGVDKFDSALAAPSTSATAQNSTKLDGVKDDDMTSSITMIAVGFIASRLYKYKMTTDIMIAAAGGAAFIVGEIMSTGKFKEVSKNLEIQQQNGDKDFTQVSSLESLKKSYENAKEAAQTKKKFQMAASAAFIGAAAVAVFMKGLEITAETATVAALTTSATAAQSAAAAAKASCAASGASCALIAPCQTAAGTFAADVAKRKKENLSRDTAIAPSLSLLPIDETFRNAFFMEVTAMAKACPAAAAAPPVVAAEDALARTNNSAGVAIAGADSDSLYLKNLRNFRFYAVTPQKQIQPGYFEKLLNLAFPKAEAGMMNLLMGGAGAGTGILLGTVTSMGVTVDTYLFAPKNRAIIWGVLGGLSFMAQKSSDNIIQKLDDNIKKIDQAINGMNPNTSSVAVAQVKQNSSLEMNPLKKEAGVNAINKDEALSLDPKNKTSCIASSGESNCTSLKSQLMSNPGFNLLPESMQTMSKDMTAMGDGLSGVNKVSATTSDLVASNGNMLNAVSKMLDKGKANLNKSMSKNGSTPPNFAKEQSGMMKKFNDNIRSVLQKNGTSPGSFLSSIGSGFGLPAGSKTPSVNDAKKDEGKSNARNEVRASIGPFSSAHVKEDALKLEDDKPEAVGAKEEEKNELSAESKLEGLELGENDITTNKDSSLFELISNRYRKSAYLRLFKKIE